MYARLQARFCTVYYRGSVFVIGAEKEVGGVREGKGRGMDGYSYGYGWDG